MLTGGVYVLHTPGMTIIRTDVDSVPLSVTSSVLISADLLLAAHRLADLGDKEMSDQLRASHRRMKDAQDEAGVFAADAAYVRGTATYKRTSASAQPGMVLLTTGSTPDAQVSVADKKTGARLRTVDHVERVAPKGYERTSRYVIHFTDSTRSFPCAPSQTWMALDH